MLYYMQNKGGEKKSKVPKIGKSSEVLSDR